MSESLLEQRAYNAMHHMRLDYAVGTYDNDTDARDAMQSVLSKENDKYFFEVLDAPQIDELGVGLALDLFTDDQCRSISTKFPEIDWTVFTQDSFFDALKQAKDSDPSLATTLKTIGRLDTDSDEWIAFAQVRHADRAIGLFLQQLVSLARDSSDTSGC